jgi:hypothetical protein
VVPTAKKIAPHVPEQQHQAEVVREGIKNFLVRKVIKCQCFPCEFRPNGRSLSKDNHTLCWQVAVASTIYSAPPIASLLQTIHSSSSVLLKQDIQLCRYTAPEGPSRACSERGVPECQNQRDPPICSSICSSLQSCVKYACCFRLAFRQAGSARRYLFAPQSSRDGRLPSPKIDALHDPSPAWLHDRALILMEMQIRFDPPAGT